jgi:hypothetical protein
MRVLSIEGAVLAARGGVRALISTEKSGIGYPAGLDRYMKHGTGVWTIERRSPHPAGAEDRPSHGRLSGTHASSHVKDRGFPDLGGDTLLFSAPTPTAEIGESGYWSAGNSEVFGAPVFRLLSRGQTWDVAASR